jgi:hypothetical protein
MAAEHAQTRAGRIPLNAIADAEPTPLTLSDDRLFVLHVAFPASSLCLLVCVARLCIARGSAASVYKALLI